MSFLDSNKWEKRFLDLAEYISVWSKDPSTKCGAVIARPDRSIVSVGYNGFPKHVRDDTVRLNDRKIKYDMVVHAERNAMLFAHQDLSECTLYTYPFMPCSACAGMTVQAGISRVVSFHSNNSRWKENFLISEIIFEEAGVELILL